MIDPQYETSVGMSCFMLKRRLSILRAGLNLFASKYTGTSKRNGYKIMFDNRFDYPTLFFLSRTDSLQRLKMFRSRERLVQGMWRAGSNREVA